MNRHVDKASANNSFSVAKDKSYKRDDGEPARRFADNRPQTAACRTLQEAANNSPQSQLTAQLQALVNTYSAHPAPMAQLTGNGCSEIERRGGASSGFDLNAPVQRYTESADGLYDVSETREFAVSKGNYPDELLTVGIAPMPLAGGLVWNPQGAVTIGETDFNRYAADISAYEANGVVGSAQHCGAFARGITGDAEAEGGNDRSTSAAGGVLKDSDASPGLEEGWENHFASVVKVDGDDHATFETAVGIPHTWVGIYGVNRGQTFKYKTQEANINRLVAMEDTVLAGLGPRKKGFWDYLLCRAGAKTDLVVPRGVTAEQGVIYRNEMNAWRLAGTQPGSDYMKRVVARLEAELVQTGGE